MELYLTDNEHSTDNVSNNSQPVSVEVGESVTLVAAVGSNWTPVTWKLPGGGEVVQSYNPYATTDQLTPIGQPGVGTNAGLQVVPSQRQHFVRVHCRRDL